MKKLLAKFRWRTKKLDPNKPSDRKKIVEAAVKRTVQEYGEALKKLGRE